MSPEQENGEKPEPSDDIYVLANCLYEALSGHRIPPGDYVALSTINEAIPPSIDKLIQDCILPRAQRIKKASEFERMLKRSLVAPYKLSEVLVDGQLHEIILAIQKLDAQEFLQLPHGQRLAFLNKAMDVVSKDQDNLRSAKKEFLVVLPRLAMLVNEEKYKKIILIALPEAFDGLGNVRIQKGLEDVSEIIQGNHHVFCEALLEYLDAQRFNDRPRWFFHRMRSIILRLMTNTTCDEADAERLNKMLETVNELQEKAPITSQRELWLERSEE